MEGINEIEKKELKHVSWVADRETFTRIGSSLFRLAIGLVDEGVELTLFCPNSADTSLIPQPPIEVIPLKIGWLPGACEKAAGEAACQLGKRKPQILHLWSQNLSSIAEELAGEIGCPWLMSISGLKDANETGRYLGKGCRGFLPLSRDIAEPLLEKLGDSRSASVHVVHPCVHPRNSSPKLHPEDQTVSIVMAGEEGGFDKGMLDFLQAVHYLVEQNLPVMGFIIGPIQDESRLLKTVAQMGLSQSITYVPQMDIEKIAGEADIFVEPYVRTEVSMSLLEAMSGGTAVIACKGSVGDCLVPQETAVLVDCGDVAQLSVKIQQLIDEPGAKMDLEKNALELIRREYSVPVVLSDTLSAYNDLLATV